jgi:hypothetical protein
LQIDSLSLPLLATVGIHLLFLELNERLQTYSESVIIHSAEGVAGKTESEVKLSQAHSKRVSTFIIPVAEMLLQILTLATIICV